MKDFVVVKYFILIGFKLFLFEVADQISVSQIFCRFGSLVPYHGISAVLKVEKCILLYSACQAIFLLLQYMASLSIS